MSTVIVGGVVGTALFFATRKLYKDKKAGKSLCGGKCSKCPGGCTCYRNGEN